MDRMIGRSSCILGWIGRWPVCCFSFPIRVRPVPGDHAALAVCAAVPMQLRFRSLSSAEVLWAFAERDGGVFRGQAADSGRPALVRLN